MEKLNKQDLIKMKPGDMKAFSAPDMESANSARAYLYKFVRSRDKHPDIERFESRIDGDVLCVRAIGKSHDAECQ